MAIQILGLREYYNKKSQQHELKETFFSKRWRADSVQSLIHNIDSILEQIPEGERYNLFYTVASCAEQRGRHLERQDIIPFDLDGIDTSKLSDYQQIVSEVIDVDQSEMAIIFTGNGLHFLVGTTKEIDYEDYFDETKIHYKAICDEINARLRQRNLEGKADTVVWSKGRILRLPNTKNIKKDKGEKNAYIIQPNIVPIEKNIIELSPLPDVEVGSFISENMLRLMPTPDTAGVQAGCEFLKHAKANQDTISEPEWYAMLSIVGRLERAEELIHEYSDQHPQYSPHATERKWQQALTASGPRTCDNICGLWDGCGSCPHFGKITSPIQITSKEFIKTENSGFHTVVYDPGTGLEKKRVPNYEDLMKYFYHKHPFVTMAEGNIVLTYNGTHWNDYAPKRIDAFAEKHFDPKPDNRMCREFYGKLTRNNIREPEWFAVEEKINFRNGVLCLDSYELEKHSTDFGFKYCLPFDYDPHATCPRFDKFMDEVTLSDKDLQSVLLEFMGYSLSHMDASLGQKALILTGDGANGKSVFMDLLKYMAGHGNYCTLNMGYEISKLENRYQLDGKLFNVSEETPAKAMMESSVFKAMVTGGEIQARKLYCDAYSMKSKAKIILACNDLPETTDLSRGMFRRLLIAPFRATFTGENQDIHIREKLYEEASGIFNRVLEALGRFKRAGHFTKADIIEQAVQAYQQDNSSVLSWFLDNMVKDKNAELDTKELYKLYRMDVEEMGIRPLNNVHFGKQLNRLPDVEVKQLRREGRRGRYLLGWKLLDKQPENF